MIGGKSVMTGTVLLLFLALYPQHLPAGEDQSKVSAESVEADTKDASETTKRATQQKNEYRKTTEARFGELDRQVDELKAKIKNGRAQGRAELNKAVEELQKREEAARKVLRELKSATVEAWENVKSKMDAAMEDWEKSYQSAVGQFRRAV